MAVDLNGRRDSARLTHGFSISSAYRMENADEYVYRPEFEDTVPLDSPLVDDHSSYVHLETEAMDSDCDDHRGNGPDFEEVVLDSEDEEVNGSRLVIVTKPTLDGVVGKRADVGNEKDRSERDGGLASSGDGISNQEHEDWSQALDFVDNFASINNVELSPRIGSRKRSLVVLGENGPQKLARKINMNNPVKGNSNFDWFEEKESPRGEVKLASDFNEETRVTNPEDDATLGDAFDAYDVGFDTQIAAEAIEALASTHPLNACLVMEEKVDSLLNGVKEYNCQTSLSDDTGEQRVKEEKRSERKFRRCNLSSRIKHCGNPELKKLIEDIEKSTAKKICSLATTNAQFKGNSEKVSPLTEESRDQGSIIRLNTTNDCRTEKMFGNTQSSMIVYMRNRSRKSAKSLRVSATNAADDCRPEKMFDSPQRNIIVYRRKRSRAAAKPLRVFAIGDSSKLCVPSEDSKMNNLTSFIKSGMWNFPRGKRTKCRARNDSPLNSHCRSECKLSKADGILTNLDSKSLSVVAAENKRRQKCKHSPKTPLLIELMNLGFSEHRPEFESKELRRRKDITNAHILFSQHLDDDIVKHQKKVAARLGVSIVSCFKDATHFVADKFTRTKNMLEAIALGKPVVTHVWLESCGQANCFIDEKNYILRDSKKEKEFGFCMPVSLTRASKHPLLKDQRVFVTPNIKPNKAMIMSLVNAVQGKIVEKAPKDEDVSEDLLILSCAEDYSICVPFLRNGLAVYSSELLLNGIVTQKLEYKRYQLLTMDAK